MNTLVVDTLQQAHAQKPFVSVKLHENTFLKEATRVLGALLMPDAFRSLKGEPPAMQAILSLQTILPCDQSSFSPYVGKNEALLKPLMDL